MWSEGAWRVPINGYAKETSEDDMRPTLTLTDHEGSTHLVHHRLRESHHGAWSNLGARCLLGIG